MFGFLKKPKLIGEDLYSFDNDKVRVERQKFRARLWRVYMREPVSGIFELISSHETEEAAMKAARKRL